MLLKIFFLFAVLATSLFADIIRPSYVEIIQKTADSYSILLKVPQTNSESSEIKVKTIDGCKEINPHLRNVINNSAIERYILECKDTIKGKTVEIEGLEDTKMDLLLRLEFSDNSSQSALLNPLNRTYTIKEDASRLQIIKTYTWLGITHILMGFDHLMFVFLLLLIVKNMRRLLWTITAFTLAHSITMAGATLGIVHVPQQPVEAIIALSILFLAMEILHEQEGRVGLASKYPWIIAFIFGLLHGFGFAGALAEIGLPHHAITLALVFFNIGVELGQLIFVTTVILFALLLKKLKHPHLIKSLETIVIYFIGGLSAFWVFERVAAF